MKKLKIAQFINIMLFALVMGILWGTWFSLSRSMASLSAETYLVIGNTIIHNLAIPMRILMPATMLSSVVTLYMLWQKKTYAFYCALLGLILMIAIIGVTLTVEVPIDNHIVKWTTSSLPPDWQIIRDRWEFYHTIRTFISITALGAVVASALLTIKENKKS